MSRPNVADWQYLGVDKITRRLEWNSGRKARKGHICEVSLAYASYSSKDVHFLHTLDLLYFMASNIIRYALVQFSLQRDTNTLDCLSV